MKRIRTVSKLLFSLSAAMAFFSFSAPAVYADAAPATSKINSGDTAWLLVSAALVLLMTPALGFFYGGMVRRKNVLGTIMHSFWALCLVSVTWVLWGYSLAFGPSIHGIIGNLSWFGLNGVGQESSPLGSPTVPHLAFMSFQMMFAVITPALITGAFAERMKFSAYTVFIILWSTFVYAPIAHWVWNPHGWLYTLGALDFAGGTVVHLNAGIAALVAAIVLGKRKGYLEVPMLPHNIGYTVLGASLLWFGWFGFNAGSAITSGGLAALAFVTTNTATAAAALGWAFAEWAHKGRPTVLGAASGAVAGLVAVTPTAGFITPMGAIAVGAIAGVICYTAVNLRPKLGYDDSLDVVGVHGLGGFWGAIATGIFASPLANPAGRGLLYGNAHQVIIQFEACGATLVWSGLVTYIILKLIDATIGLRVSESEEELGLDLSQHEESGYNL
ncbi:MAG: ammonium transporter [Nitrospiraceae bacterium]|nr:ammonium transporter [Nitrospiraceae bacterium]